MKRSTILFAVLAALLLIGGGTAFAVDRAAKPAASSDLASDLRAIDRSAVWSQVSRLDLHFPTYHPEGLVITRHRIYLSSVQVIEPTVKYPEPVGGYDRTPGKGIGHLFVLNRTGGLLKDIRLGHGIVYHPGGIDYDGRYIWVPVAQYRPNSSAEIDRVDTRTLDVSTRFTVADHIGGIVLDKTTGHLVGNNWGSRTMYEWRPAGGLVSTWKNPDDLLDAQDCQYVPDGLMSCGGVTNLPQTPTAGGTSATYELGGLILFDLHRHTVVNEIPFQEWSTAGHVMTRNPLKLAAHGRTMTMWAAPDNGDEGVGTQLYEFRTTLPA
jgi:hypothetical protein